MTPTRQLRPLVDRLGPVAGDVWQLGRRRGIRRAGLELLLRLRRKVYERHDECVLMTLLSEPPEPAPLAPGVRIAPAGPDALAALDAFNRVHGNRRATRRFARELAAGSSTLLAFAGAELAGYSWAVGGVRAAERDIVRRHGIRPRPDDAYCFELYVAPEHRGKGIGAQLIAAQDARLFRLGYRRAWRVFDVTDDPARRVHTAGMATGTGTRVRSQVLLSRWVVAHGRLRRMRAYKP